MTDSVITASVVAAVQQHTNRKFFKHLLTTFANTLEVEGYVLTETSRSAAATITPETRKTLERRLLKNRTLLLHPDMDNDTADEVIRGEISEGYGRMWVDTLFESLATEGIFPVHIGDLKPRHG